MGPHAKVRTIENCKDFDDAEGAWDVYRRAGICHPQDGLAKIILLEPLSPFRHGLDLTAGAIRFYSRSNFALFAPSGRLSALAIGSGLRRTGSLRIKVDSIFFNDQGTSADL